MTVYICRYSNTSRKQYEKLKNCKKKLPKLEKSVSKTEKPKKLRTIITKMDSGAGKVTVLYCSQDWKNKYKNEYP